MKNQFSRFFLTVRRASLCGFIFLATFLLISWPHFAVAQATVGEVMCNARNNIGPYAGFLSALAWLLGGALIGMGVLHFKNNQDSPHNHPVYQGVLKIAGGAALMTLPFFVSALYRSVYTDAAITDNGGGLVSCTAAGTAAGGYVVPAVGLPDLVTMLTNMVQNIEYPVIALIEVTSTIMGMVFIILGIIKASKHGTDPRGSSIPNILTHLVIGALLICSGESFASMIGTLFGATAISDDVNTSAGTVLTWNAVIALGGDANFATAIASGLTFIQIVGCLAFIRGLYIVKKAVEGSGQATLAQGMTHLIGGAIAFNIYEFLEGMDATFGTGLL